jgi:CubicO group peptidase (beta-lactamase class C family)
MQHSSILTLFLLFFNVSNLLNAQDSRIAKLEKLAQEMSDSLSFKGVIMVAEGVNELMTYTDGKASHEFNVPHNKETKFRIASITKMMTSYAIFILKSKQKLNLDQPISSFFPEIKKDITSKVTVRHLLKHRSGLVRDFSMLSEEVDLRYHKSGELIALLNNTELAFEPGTSYAYSNVGYTLLGLIISRIMELPYGEAMQRLIFDPLNMNSTGHEVFDDIIEHKATGYDRLYDELVKAKSGFSSNVLGAGSLYSNAPDLLKFSEEIQKGSLLAKEDLDLYLKDNGNFQTEGGWVTWEYGKGSGKNKQVIMHGGSKPGYRSVIAIFLTDEITVIALTNHTPMNISLYYNNLGNAALGDEKDYVLQPQLEKLMPFILEGKFDIAEKMYLQNLSGVQGIEKIKPSEINSYGYIFLEHGRTEEAIKIFQFAILLFPDNANAYDSLGEGLFKNGEIEESISMYKKSLELNPDNQGAKEFLKRNEVKK